MSQQPHRSVIRLRKSIGGDHQTRLEDYFKLLAMVLASRFPRAAKYNFDWVIENHMGHNTLWLTEAMSQVMNIRPEMRVLDLGCGKAISSIFLAKEFGCQVWASDLGVDWRDNLKRIRDARMENLVFPVQ